MDKDRKIAMLIAANILAKKPIDQLDKQDFATMINHGNIIGGFICGARWADRNP